jgi:hypothetical protein
MRKREIIIVLAVIAFGIIFNAIKSGDFDIRFHNGISGVSWQLKDKSFPNNFDREEIRFSQVEKLEICNIAGDIVVEKADVVNDETSESNVRIIPSIRIYHRDKKEAREIEKIIKFKTIEEDISADNTQDKPGHKKIKIDVNSTDEFPLRRVRINFKLVIHENVQLDLRNKYGDMVIDGCGENISLEGKYGDITVKHVDSAVKIQHKNGRVVLTDIQNSIQLSSRNSRIRVSNVADLKLDCYLANADISQVENQVNIENAAYSTIVMEKGNEVSIDGRHTKIKLTDIKNNVRIKNSHHAITLRKITGNIHINANNCKINLDRITSSDVVIKNAHNYVNIDKISADNVDILMKSGDLDIDFDQIKEKINIKNRHSKVTLIYPSSINPVFDIQAKYGSITNRTSGDLAILKERGQESAASNYREGKPIITINTTYGDILLETNSRMKPGD